MPELFLAHRADCPDRLTARHGRLDTGVQERNANPLSGQYREPRIARARVRRNTFGVILHLSGPETLRLSPRWSRIRGISARFECGRLHCLPGGLSVRIRPQSSARIKQRTGQTSLKPRSTIKALLRSNRESPA